MTLHLCLVVERRGGEPAISPVFAQVLELLRERGFRVDVLVPEAPAWRADLVAASHDLYLLKSDTELALSMAGILHAHEARILNPYPNCLVAKDKIVAARRLKAGGIPTPHSWAVADLDAVRPILEEVPVVIKPARGFHGEGVCKVWTPEELAAMPRPRAPLLVQECIQGSGEDLKVYVVGAQVFATRKPFSARSFVAPGQPCTVDAEIRGIARRCGEVFGLGLYGLDVVECEGGPYVVDLNYFPGYKGVPGAPQALADYIESYARGRVWLPLAGPIEPSESTEGPQLGWWDRPPRGSPAPHLSLECARDR
jgi:ribosomal protein S6--L-glutamate ligase